MESVSVTCRDSPCGLSGGAGLRELASFPCDLAAEVQPDMTVLKALASHPIIQGSCDSSAKSIIWSTLSEKHWSVNPKRRPARGTIRHSSGIPPKAQLLDWKPAKSSARMLSANPCARRK